MRTFHSVSSNADVVYIHGIGQNEELNNGISLQISPVFPFLLFQDPIHDTTLHLAPSFSKTVYYLAVLGLSCGTNSLHHGMQDLSLECMGSLFVASGL